jgi:type I restriction enzyme R subunit
VKIAETVQRVKPDDFRGYKAKENVIKAALYPLLDDNPEEVERIYRILEAQKEY